MLERRKAAFSCHLPVFEKFLAEYENNILASIS